MTGAVAALALATFGTVIERRQALQAASHIVDDPARLPACEAGLVLGTQPLTRFRDGKVTLNIPFLHRLDAAVLLWRSGKVKFLLLSGKRDGDYDEPAVMRANLREHDVPADALRIDGDGWRTLDSILRARQIYGLKRIVIVSQRAHLERAIYLARHAGIDAWGLTSQEEGKGGPGWFYRTVVALRAWWDVQVGTLPRV